MSASDAGEVPRRRHVRGSRSGVPAPSFVSACAYAVVIGRSVFDMTLGIGFNDENFRAYVLRASTSPVSTVAGLLRYGSLCGVAGQGGMLSSWPENEKGRRKAGSQRANPQQMPSHQALVRCAACHPLTGSEMCHGARIRGTEARHVCLEPCVAAVQTASVAFVRLSQRGG